MRRCYAGSLGAVPPTDLEEQEEYADPMTRPEDQTGADAPAQGEVLISGLDTGPDAATRENLSPTERRVRLEEQRRPDREPEDEDG